MHARNVRLALGAIAGILLVGWAVWLFAGSDDTADSGDDVASRSLVDVPPHVVPRARDPHADPASVRTLPPAHQLFGFSDPTFTYTGVLPAYDQGVTPAREAADLRRAGANAARVALSWYDLEPKPGRYDATYASRISAFVRAFEHAGGKVLLVLGGPPAWARADAGSPTSAPVDRADVERAYARMAAFVARTWPTAAGIETWNEPNIATFWHPYGPQPERFARWHIAAARAIRAQRHHPPVVLAGLAAYTSDGDDVLSAQTFLTRMFAAGLQPSDYDAVALHVYPAQRDGRAERLDEGSAAEQLDDLRLGLRWIDGTTPLWITETGLTTSGRDRIGDAEQGTALPLLVRGLLSLDRVGAVFVHTLYEPKPESAGSTQRGFGIIDARDGSARLKPAYCAFAALHRAGPRPPGCPRS